MGRHDKGICMDNEVYVGVDVHERESQIAVLDKDGELLEEKRLPTGSLTNYVCVFHQWKETCCSGGCWFYISDI